MSYQRCNYGRQLYGPTVKTPCPERPEGDSFYCATHKAVAAARVATVRGGDRVRPWTGRNYWLAGRDSA